MTPTEIIWLIIALAFVILVIFLVKLIWTACQTLRKINESLEGGILQDAEEIIGGFNKKMKSLDPFFNSLENVGGYFENRTSSLKEEEYHHKEKERSRHSESKVDAFLDLGLLGINLWKKFKKGDQDE